ncbi:MAG: hypothetical protein LBV39_05970, partial [Bacteroidales bacterium]|nr:hypothetical protein [Bacteroidales bacterium]
MSTFHTIRIQNRQAIKTSDIPVLPYSEFMECNSRLPEEERYHCVSYFALPEDGQFRFICCMADD